MRILITILLIILGYYLLGFLLRLVMPRLRAYMIRKAENHFHEAFGNPEFRQQKEAPEGEVSIEQTPTRKSHSKKPVGEYIEFEEIE